METLGVELCWADLPHHLVDSILDKLTPLRDYLHFSGVCKSWRHVALHNKRRRCLFNSSLPQLPFLLIPTPCDTPEKRRLFSVAQNKVYESQVLKLPYSRRCCGSSHGWLIAVEETMHITLFNPFSNNKVIRLPPLTKDIPVIPDHEPPLKYEFFVKKAVLSKDPILHPNDYEVALIYDGVFRLAFFKSGDKAWTYPSDLKHVHLFHDIISFKGKFYAVDSWLGVARMEYCDITDKVKTVVVSPRPAPRSLDLIFQGISYTYIVETSNRDLLLIEGFLHPEGDGEDDVQPMTVKFKVYKLVHSDERQWPKLVEINSLGDNVLFLGDNRSLFVCASDYPGCRANCIYFTDDIMDITQYVPFGPRDTGVFCLEDSSVSSHYVPNPSQKHLPPPVWILPTLPGDWT